MNIKSIYVNLPVKNLKKTRDFWTALGFTFNEQFSDEKALCLVLQEGVMYSMLITHEFFSTFTNRSIADNLTTQVLIAIEVESKEMVDDIMKKALENGGSRYRDNADHGWMYYDSFADIDGHQWEVMFMDPSKIPS
ncbi:MAG: VOC family protein [Saprospiraceae bacterium]